MTSKLRNSRDTLQLTSNMYMNVCRETSSIKKDQMVIEDLLLNGQLFDNMLPLMCESISILRIAPPEISIKSTVIQVI